MDKAAASYRRYLEGDRDALNEVMEELFFPLIFFVNRYVRDVPTAEDLAMDAVTELLLHPRRYDFRVSLKTYLFLLGKSKALSWLRRQRRRGDEPLSEELSADEQELEERVLADQRSLVLNAALERLPQEQRMAIHLVYFEELSYEETGKIMKKSRKQVDNLLYQAKKQLRIILGEEGRTLL